VIVLDASAAVELLLGTPMGDEVQRRMESRRLNAPHLLSVEVAQALRRLVMTGTVAHFDAADCLVDLDNMLIRRWRHEPLLARVWELRSNLTAYDAVYVALAEALEATLLTADARLARSSAHDAQVELVTG